MKLPADRPRTRSALSRRQRHTLVSVVSLGVLALGVLPPVAAEGVVGDPGEIFEQHDVALGAVARPTVLTRFFLGGGRAELAVVDVDENGSRRLHFYAFGETTWTSALEATLGRDVLFVDVANIDGRDRLITYREGRLDWFDPESVKERLLVDIAASFDGASTGRRYAGTEALNPSHYGRIPHVDITRDLNHDGRDDLVIPDFDGFWISTQSSDGSFADFVKGGPMSLFSTTRPWMTSAPTTMWALPP